MVGTFSQSPRFNAQHLIDQARWYKPSPALGRWRREVKVSSCCAVSQGAAWDPHLKNRQPAGDMDLACEPDDPSNECTARTGCECLSSDLQDVSCGAHTIHTHHAPVYT